jgi:hypothetical protein
MDEQRYTSEIISLANDLDVDLDNVFHFITIGGIEIVSELGNITHDELGDISESDFSLFNENKYLLINPIRIRRDEFRTIDIWESRELFTPLSFSADNLFYTMNENSIITKGFPDSDTILQYLSTLYEIYYPYQLDITLEDTEENQYKDNVIDFSKYKKD